jgi:hypothetical protein
MNIEIKDNKTDLLEKICKEIEMNPTQLIDFLLAFMQNVYSEYKRDAKTKKGTFKETLTNLSFDLSKVRTVEKRLIESTNELLGIEEYADAGIYNIDLDFYSRNIFYTIGYEFVNAAKMNAFKGLLINVEINQDHIEASNVLYLPLFGMEISDKKASDTMNFAQEFIRDINRDEFSPYVNFDVEVFPEVDSPSNQTIRIKLIVKTDKATHMPHIETISRIIREVYEIVFKELITKAYTHNQEPGKKVG